MVWGKKAKKALKQEASSESEVDSEEERILMEKLKKIRAKKKSKVFVDDKVEKLKEIERRKGYKFEEL